MSTHLLQPCVTVLGALCAAGLAFYVLQAARAITYVTLADGRRAMRSLPFVFRLLLPFAGNLARFAARPACARLREAADRMLRQAGYEGVLDGGDFIALKILTPLFCGGAWIVLMLLLGVLLPGSILATQAPLLMVLGVVAAYVYPLLWLRGAVKRRQAAIVRALPFVLDLLTLSVEAGMDFMSALQRNCSRQNPDPLNEELLRMVREIQVGTPRRTALRNLADRVGQVDLRGVVHALVQADELGVSIGSILRIQSDQLRGRRFDRAEKLANEAPVKMLGPLLLCIFPAVFIVLMGPILSQAMKNLF